jgi:hypothetical protein
MEKEFLYKNRSFSSCLNTAYVWFCDNFKTIVRVTWLPLLIYSIFAGLSLVCTLRDARIVEFAEQSPGLFLTIFIVASIGVLACYLWAWSRLLSLLNGLTGKKNILLLLILFLSDIVIGFIIGGILFGGSWLLFRHQGVTPAAFLLDNWLVCLIGFIVILLLTLPLAYASARYIMKPDTSYLLDLPKTYPTGLRHLGFIFITTLITGIITGIIAIVIALPQLILMTAQTISAFGVQQGDPSGMPGYFIPLHGATTAVTTILFFYLTVYMLLVSVFMYGSIEKEEEVRHATLISEEAPTDNEQQPKTF